MSTSPSARIDSSDLFAQPIVRTFFENPENRRLYREFTEKGSDTAKEQLEVAFRHFFFGIRFAMFLRSTIRFSEIELARKQRKYQNRHPLIFDKQVDEEGERTFGEDLLCVLTTQRIDDVTTKPEVFIASLDHEVMDNQQWLTILSASIGNFGFPIVLTSYLLIRFEKKLDNLSLMIQTLVEVLRDEVRK